MGAVNCFPPVARPDARLLILGSMPGQASLTAGCYYAHPRNSFWPIMGDLLGFSPRLPYARRLERLHAAGIALWDVLARCERVGSLDSDIIPGSVEVNDFPGFFAVHPDIRHVFFNGSAAEAAFRRDVLPELPHLELQLSRLPSTSPAHAARGYAEKLAAWSAIVALPGMRKTGSV